MKAQVYTQEGKKSKSVDLPDGVFARPWNADLVHQVVTSLESNQRRGTAHTKDRSEVRGGGRKPWRQKGTGRARHGSRRSPIWVGGAVTHGPRAEKKYHKKINAKMRRRALTTLLSQKMRDGEMLLVDTLTLDEPKTRKAKSVLANLADVEGFDVLGSRVRNTALIALDTDNPETRRAFQNIGNVAIQDVRNLSALDVARYKNVILINPEQSVSVLESKVS